MKNRRIIVTLFTSDPIPWMMKQKKYIIGNEICPSTGKQHYQCFVETSRYYGNDELKKVLCNSHYEKAMGTDEQNYAYCSKDKDFKTNMEIKVKLQHEEEIKEEPKDWQIEIAERFNHAIKKNRIVTWICGRKGNEGKTWFAEYLIRKYQDVVYLQNAKTSDILFAINEDTDLVIFDFSRSHYNINYNAIETVKNGILFSSKYESASKILKHKPVVLCLSNQMPDISRLSLDRWEIFEIIDQKLIKVATSCVQ